MTWYSEGDFGSHFDVFGHPWIIFSVVSWFYMVFHGFSLFFMVFMVFMGFSLFFHGFFKELDFKELEIHRYSLLDIQIFIVGHPDIHCWTSRYSLLDIPIFIVGLPDIHCWTSRYSLLDIHQWIHWWTINEFIDGPSMNMVHQWIHWAPFFGPFFGPHGAPVGQHEPTSITN